MMEKIECHWCGCEMTPTVIGHFDDGSTFVNVFCTSFCEMESLTDGRFRKRSILKAIFTEAMCDAYFQAKREGKVPGKNSRLATRHIGVEPVALWDTSSDWNIFEPDFQPVA